MFEPLSFQQINHVNDENRPISTSHYMKTQQSSDRNQRKQSLNKNNNSDYSCSVLGNHNPKVIPNVHNIFTGSNNLKKKSISSAIGKQKKGQNEECKIDFKPQRVGSVQGHAILKRLTQENELQSQNTHHHSKGSFTGSMQSIKQIPAACVVEDVDDSEHQSEGSGESNAIHSLRGTLSSLKQDKKGADLATLIRDLNDMCSNENVILSNSLLLKTALQQQQQQQQQQPNLQKEQKEQHNIKEKLIKSSSNSSLSHSEYLKEDLSENENLHTHQFITEINNNIVNKEEEEYLHQVQSVKSSMKKTRSCNSNGETRKKSYSYYQPNSQEQFPSSIQNSKKSHTELKNASNVSRDAIENLKFKLAINSGNESVLGYKNQNENTSNLNRQPSNIYYDHSKKRVSESAAINTMGQQEEPKRAASSSAYSYQKINQKNRIISDNNSSCTPKRESKSTKCSNNNNMYVSENNRSTNSKYYTTILTQSNRLQQQQQWLHKQEYQSESRRNMLKKMCNFTQMARGKYSFHKLNKQKKELNNISHVLYNSLLENYEVDASLQSKSLSVNSYTVKNQQLLQQQPIINTNKESPIRQRAYDKEESDSPDFNHIRKYYNQKYGQKLKKFESEQQQNNKITPLKKNYVYQRRHQQTYSSLTSSANHHSSGANKDSSFYKLPYNFTEQAEIYRRDDRENEEVEHKFGLSIHPVVNEFQIVPEACLPHPIIESPLITPGNSQGIQNIIQHTLTAQPQTRNKRQYLSKPHRNFDIEIMPWGSDEKK